MTHTLVHWVPCYLLVFAVTWLSSASAAIRSPCTSTACTATTDMSIPPTSDSSNSWGKVARPSSRLVASLHSDDSWDPALLVRGGAGWFGWFGQSSKTVEDRYRQSLEEQILILQRQTRAARDETMQLRKLAKLTSRSNTRDNTSNIKNNELVASIQEEISILQKQIEQMESFTQELQQLLQEEKERSADLKKKLEAAGANILELQREHEQELEQLQRTLLIKSKKELEELNTLMETRIREAAERARKEALLFMDQKIKDAVSKVEAKARADLEEERQKAADAVEKERVKMRKLVKVLAEREKKLSTPAAATTTKASSSSKTVTAGSSSRKQQAATTIRSSPIKNT